jgi:hypothetical protein
VTWFRYVPYAHLLWRFAEGWEPIADLGDTHGAYAVLCRWTGEDEP